MGRGRPPRDPNGQTLKPRAVRFTDDEWEALKRIARRDGCSIASLVRNWVLEHLTTPCRAPYAAPQHPSPTTLAGLLG